MEYTELQKKRIDVLHDRKTAYVQIFGTGPAVDAVLKDLDKFCRASESCFHADPRLHAVLEGRREVWLRIQDYLKLSPEQLWEKYDGRGDE